MKRKIILGLSFLIIFLTLLWSCHSEDFTNGENNPQRNNANFFKHSQQNGMNAKAGIAYSSILEAYNRKTDFLSKMPDQRGMPIWEKMMVLETETKTALFIPLSYDKSTMSSILFVNIDEKNNVKGVRNIDNEMLENIVEDTRQEIPVRENLMNTFLMLDQHTFGTTEFTNIPDGLFKDNVKGAYNRLHITNFDYEVKDDPKTNRMIITTCQVVWACKQSKTWEECDKCGTCLKKTNCKHFFLDGGDGTIPLPEIITLPPGGGPSPNPNAPPKPKDPCALQNVFYRMLTGCQTGGGDTDLPSLEDPCEKTKAILNNPDVQNKLDSLKNKSLSKGEIGFKTKKDGTVTGIISGGKHEVNLGVKVGYQGGYHNHTPTGIPMHSPPDIDNNLLAFARAQPTGEHKNAYFGMIVKKVCSSCTSGFKIYHYIIRFDGTHSDALTSFSQLDLDNFNIDYQNREFDMTNPTGTYGTNYIDSIGKITVQGLEKLFFDTLKAMNLTNKILLQRIEEDGTINNITINSAGTHTTATPCP